MYQIFETADRLIDEDKREEYGDLGMSFNAIAKVWSGILKIQVSSKEVALCMIGLKLCRESFKHKEDNLVDICGYVKCLGGLTDARTKESS